MSYQPTVSSFFSGAGLMDIGLSEAGLNVVQSFEIDKNACKTYQENFGESIKQVDITKQMVSDIEDTDIHCFTYPCTKYSRIADIHQTRTGDELFLHALRHLAISRPEAYIVENVPGMRAFPVANTEAYKQIGNGVPVDLARWAGSEMVRYFN